MKKIKKIIPAFFLCMLMLTVLQAGGEPICTSKAATETVSRGQWIHNLVAVFGMDMEETSLPDNYYADIKEGDAYYDDIMLASGYGVIDLEAGKNFEPDGAVTREFAAHTLNFCLGFQLKEGSEYTFSDNGDCTWAEDDQVALNRGWIFLSNGKFLPQQPLTASESGVMLDDARKILADAEIDSGNKNIWHVKTGVIEVPKGTDVVVASDIVTIHECPVTISEGNIFVIYQGEIAVPFQAVSVAGTGTEVTIQTREAEYEDAFTDIAAEGIIDSDGLVFEAADGVELTDLESSSAAYNSRIVTKIKDKKFKKSFQLSNGVTATLNGTIKNIRVEFKILSDNGGTALAKVSADISITDEVKVVPVLIGNASLPLFTVDIAGLGGLTVNAEIKTAGTMSTTLNQHVEIGLSCSRSQGFRIIKSFKENGGSNSTISAEASLGINARLGLTKWPAITGYVYANAGITGKFVDTVYTDGKKPVNCRTFLAYVYANCGAKAGCSYINYEYDNKIEIYNFKNSPFRVYHHYEDGSEVPRCARGETLEYFTKYYSKYWGTGWSEGFGKYGYNDAGEPYQIYEYTLSENEKGENVATITKYHGNVTNLAIPEKLDGYKVVGIGSNAFSGNAYLMGVTIPDSVVKIGRWGFQNCSNLATVNLSKNLQEMEMEVFGNCSSISEIEIPKSLVKCYTQFNNLDDDYAGPFNECSNLKRVIFEEGTKRIAECLFAGCTGIEEIQIPDKVTLVGDKAFNGCKNLVGITIPDSVTKIKWAAFANCTSLQSLDMGDNVTCMEDRVFLNDSNLKTVNLSKSLEEMGYMAFGNCISITEIKIPKSLVKCYTRFNNLDYVYDGPFNECSNLKKITFEEGTKRIAECLFAGCTGIEEIQIPDTVTLIGDKAFNGCKNLVGITIPDSVTRINWAAFANCTNLRSLDMGDNVTCMEDRVFLNDSNLTTVNLSKSLEEMGYMAFGNCISITEIKIPKSLMKCHASYDNLDYVYDGAFNECSNLKKITFEEGTKRVAECLFAGCTGIEEIHIPDTVTLIGDKAFEGCKNLRTVTIPDGVKKINWVAFANCTSLEAIEIPPSVANIGTQLFMNCTNLKTVKVPDQWTCFSERIFEGCSSLENITLPEKLETINYRSFRNCTSLEKIKIPASVRKIERDAFSYCESLSDLVIENGVSDIGLYAFEYCKSLKKVILPDSVRTIGNGVFQKCDILSEVKIGAGVREIPEYAFYEDPKIEKIILPQQVTKIGASAFANCTSLTDITINRNVAEIGKDVFSYPAKLTIHGVENTYAQTYANENNITFDKLNIPVQDLALSNTKCQLGRGHALFLTAAITPEDSSDELIWTSTDESIVTVDKMGQIKGIKTGKATVAAMIGSIVRTCEVTVYEPVTRVSLDITNKDMAPGETLQLKASISPSNATNQNVVWTSGDETVATVDQTGLVKAVSFGTAEITVKTEDQNKKAVCKITVKPTTVTGISLNKKELTMKEGDTFQLEAVIIPDNAVNKTVEWSSSAPDIVTVKNGLLTAVGKGTAVIAAKTEEGGKVAVCNVTVTDKSNSGENPSPSPSPDQNSGSSGKQNAGEGKNENNINKNIEKDSDYTDDGSEDKVTAPAKAKIQSAKNKKGRKLFIKWKKVKGAKGYQIQYGNNKKFKSKKTKYSKKTSITLKGLKKKKICYVRIRAYKMNGSKKVFGKWSKIKKVRIKR